MSRFFKIPNNYAASKIAMSIPIHAIKLVGLSGYPLNTNFEVSKNENNIKYIVNSLM